MEKLYCPQAPHTFISKFWILFLKNLIPEFELVFLWSVPEFGVAGTDKTLLWSKVPTSMLSFHQ